MSDADAGRTRTPGLTLPPTDRAARARTDDALRRRLRRRRQLRERQITARRILFAASTYHSTR